MSMREDAETSIFVVITTVFSLPPNFCLYFISLSFIFIWFKHYSQTISYVIYILNHFLVRHRWVYYMGLSNDDYSEEKNRKLSVCINYMALNKVTLKDHF